MNVKSQPALLLLVTAATALSVIANATFGRISDVATFGVIALAVVAWLYAVVLAVRLRRGREAGN